MRSRGERVDRRAVTGTRRAGSWRALAPRFSPKWPCSQPHGSVQRLEAGCRPTPPACANASLTEAALSVFGSPVGAPMYAGVRLTATRGDVDRHTRRRVRLVARAEVDARPSVAGSSEPVVAGTPLSSGPRRASRAACRCRRARAARRCPPARSPPLSPGGGGGGRCSLGISSGPRLLVVLPGLRDLKNKNTFFKVDAPIDQVYDALIDVESVTPYGPQRTMFASCRSSGEGFEVGIEVKGGPMSMLYRST